MSKELTKACIYKKGIVNPDGSIIDPIRISCYKSMDDARLMLSIKYKGDNYYAQEMEYVNGCLEASNTEPFYQTVFH